MDVTVAAADLKAGDVALSVPQNLVVTLDRIFESEGLAEMLTAGKLSELAVMTLYMMYEKKVRAELVDVKRGGLQVSKQKGVEECCRREKAFIWWGWGIGRQDQSVNQCCVVFLPIPNAPTHSSDPWPQ